MLHSSRSVSACIVIALVATVFAVPAQAVMPAPTWTPGDYWAYSLVAGGTPMGRMRLDVVGIETVVVGGIPYPSYRTTVDERIALPPPFSLWENLTGVYWYRLSDYAPVAQVANGTIEPPNPAMTLNGTMAFDPPERIQWPLTPLDAWTTSGWVNVSTSINGAPPMWQNWMVTVDYRVEAERPVTVPAGTFPTTPLNGTSSGSSNVTYWSPTVGNGVLLQTLDPTGAEMQRMELTDFRYQAGGPVNSPPTVALMSPSGGEDWTGGSTHPIAYVTADPDNGTLDVTVEASLDGGATWSPIGSFPAQPTGPQTFAWTVPPVDTTRARIRVCASDRVNPPTCAASGDFTIDSTRPALVAIDPLGGASGIPVNQAVTITFSEAMDRPSTQAAVSIVPAVPGIVYSWPDPASLRVDHNDFTPCTTYTVSVANGARDISDPGNFLSGAGPVPNPWTFTTACGLSIVRTDPYDGETNVELTRPIVVEFSGPVNTTSLSFTITPPVGPLVPVWSGGNTVLTIQHATSFAPCTTYTVTVTSPDLVPGLVPNPWSFTTVCNPHIDSTSPANGAIVADLLVPILVNFSVPMAPASLRWSIVPDPGLVPAWSNGDTTLTLTHVQPFASMTSYAVQVWANDTAGRPLVPGPVPNPWSFSTAGCGPSIVTTSPYHGQGEVPLDEPVNITFCNPMNVATVVVTFAPPVAGLTFTWYGGDRGVLIHHDPFAPCTQYTVTVVGQDLFLNPLVPGPVPNPWTFTTVCAPTVSVSAPAGGERWSAGTAHDVSFTTGDADTTLSLWVNLSTDGGATFPTNLFTGSRARGATVVPVTLPAIATDAPDSRIRVTAQDSTGLDGNATSPAFTIDGTAPTVTSSDPGPGAAGVSLTAPFTIVFSERMNATATDPAISLSPGTWTLSVTWSADGRTATVAHGALAAGTQHTLHVASTAKDASDPGNALAAAYSAAFTTGLADTTPPTIAHTPPAAVYIGDTIRINATVTDAGSGVDHVYLVYTPIGAQEQNVTMTLSGGVWSYTIPAASAAGTVHYRIVAVDKAGNWAGTTEYAVEVRARPPPTPSPDLLPYLLVILAIAVALAVVLLVVLRRRKKKAEPETPPAEEAPEEPPPS